MNWVSLVLAVSFGVGLYAYLGYPLLLKLVDLLRSASAPLPPTNADWPTISITVPVYNEADAIAALLENLLALDYPTSRRQILVVSDASADGTDDIVGRFATPGVVHAFFRRSGGQLVELDVVAGATSTDATGISPSGDIVGSVTFREGATTRTRGFIQRA